MEKCIQIACSAAETVDIDRLQPLQGNLKNLTKSNALKLKNSILKSGFSFPFFVWRDGTGSCLILDGHQRLEVLNLLKSEGYEIPALPIVNIHARDLQEAREKILLASSQYGTLTTEGLREFVNLLDLPLDELKKTVALDIDLNRILQTEVTEGNLPPAPTTPVSKLGDLWTLGSHRLLCGDSTDPANVNKLLNNEVPFIMTTDPPYGVSYNATWRDSRDGQFGDGAPVMRGKVENDDRKDWSAAYKLFPGDVCYVWHASVYAGEVALNLLSADLLIRTQIIWVKPHFTLSRGAYHYRHEPCWYCVRKGAKSKWGGDRTQSTVWEIKGMNPAGNCGEEKFNHSTQKPVECMARPIRNHGDTNDSVYDPFLGTGTTIIACESLKRKCFGLEISPTYCDIILQRYKNFSGVDPVREDGKKFSGLQTGISSNG